eukprot:4157546-Prymnesium_polylepis.2
MATSSARHSPCISTSRAMASLGGPISATSAWTTDSNSAAGAEAGDSARSGCDGVLASSGSAAAATS